MIVLQYGSLISVWCIGGHRIIPDWCNMSVISERMFQGDHSPDRECLLRHMIKGGSEQVEIKIKEMGWTENCPAVFKIDLFSSIKMYISTDVSYTVHPAIPPKRDSSVRLCS